MQPVDLLIGALALLLAAFVLSIAIGFVMAAVFCLAWAWRITGEFVYPGGVCEGDPPETPRPKPKRDVSVRGGYQPTSPEQPPPPPKGGSKIK